MVAQQSREALFAGGLGITLLSYAAVTLSAADIPLLDYLRLLAAYLRIAGSIWLLVVLIGIAILIYRNRPRRGGTAPSPLTVIARTLHERWARDRFISLLAPPLLFSLLMATFNAFKQAVLYQAGFGVEAQLAALDRMLFLGVDAWRITHALFPSPWTSWLIDKAYHAWFVPMSLGVILCSILPARLNRTRLRYLMTYIAAWIVVGSVMAMLMPSAGPGFQPTPIGQVAGFEPMAAHLQAQQAWLRAHFPGADISALHFQQMLLQLHGSSHITVGGGISAMPSMHNALAALFAMAAFQFSRMAGLAMSGYALLIWIGSIHLGWHYAVDGPVAVLVTYGLWRISAPIADWLLAERSQVPVAEAA